MRIKSFYASSVEAAVALARRELGAEAMLVQSRKSPAEACHLGEYEVVCALVPEGAPVPPVQSAAAEAMPFETRLAREIAELRRQLDTMGKTITRTAWTGANWAAVSPALAEMHSRLMAADIDGEISSQILDAAHRRCADSPAGHHLQRAVTAELQNRILVNATLGKSPDDSPKIVSLVGPPGSGKTTSITKIAINCGLLERRSVLLVSMDDYRVSGAEQLRSYAAILGTAFQAVETVAGLAQALEDHRSKGLILIDTPGYGPRDMDRAGDLARFIKGRPEISTHLTLTATMKSADLLRVADRFEVFGPSRLIFTRLDETEAFGTAFSAAVRVNKPISFLGTGQVIPDDCEPATREGIMELLWHDTANVARSAA
ncbi:MAG: hypothetical protein U0Q18_14090 [Bryobacteraceae bacterium]